MGYQKGFIDISPDRDVPVLQQVLSSQIVSRSQLMAFLRLRRFECSRHAFNWRVRRLVGHGLLSVLQLPPICRDDLFAITNRGIACLEKHGVFSPAAFPPADRNLKELSLLHTLELNNIHLALLQSGMLIGWTPEIQIRSSLLLGSSLHAKAYDAMVHVMLDDQLVRFALEYERTQKGAQEYGQVRESLESDAAGPPVLYLFPSQSLLACVARHFRGSKRRIWFGMVEEFKASLFEAKVSDARGSSCSNLAKHCQAADWVTGYVSAAFRFGFGCFFRCDRCPGGSIDYDLSTPDQCLLLTPMSYLPDWPRAELNQS